MAKHKHYDVIVAWAEGKLIQHKGPLDKEWVDADNPLQGCNWYGNYQYRVKPAPVMYRLYTYPDISSVGVVIQNYSDTESRELHIPLTNRNVIWLTDWLELPKQKEK